MQADPFDRDQTVVYDRAEELTLPGQVRVRRLTCQNPSAMTFTGTQSYLIGSGDVALIDPGPEQEDHLGRLIATLEPGERISHVLVTHSHTDHSPGARWIKARTDAEVLAFGPHGAGMTPTMQELAANSRIGGGEGSDPEFLPDRQVGEGDRITGSDWAVHVLHTPGHLSNHLAFALEGAGAIFTGDAVMGWATTLVSPPDGDMRAFMASLDRLEAADARVFLPGHGHPVRDPTAMIAHQRRHRQTRAAQILRALEDGSLDSRALTRLIYTEVDPALLPAAERNVLSTLIWQMEEGHVAPEGPLGPSTRFRLI